MCETFSIIDAHMKGEMMKWMERCDNTKRPTLHLILLELKGWLRLGIRSTIQPEPDGSTQEHSTR